MKNLSITDVQIAGGEYYIDIDVEYPVARIHVTDRHAVLEIEGDPVKYVDVDAFRRLTATETVMILNFITMLNAIRLHERDMYAIKYDILNKK